MTSLTRAAVPFVDTHVHFWDRDVAGLDWGWLEDGAVDPVTGDDYGALNAQRFLPRQLQAEGRFQNLAQVVHVQCATGRRDPKTGTVEWRQVCDPVRETEWLQGLADQVGSPDGIVAYVDLASESAAATLERHASSPALRGVRDLRYDDYLRSERWQRGLAHVAEHGLVLCDDPLLEDMPDAARVAERFPELVWCVDHAGFPRQRDPAYFARWRKHMRRLAAVPSTVVKISGLGMGDPDWTLESLRPWVLECIEAWGTDRAFFGTNWPVDRSYASYADVVGAYRAIAAEFTAAEQVAMLSENAKRVFRL